MLMVNLNVNGLNAPRKIQNGWADENMYMYTRSLTTSFYLIPQIVCDILYCQVNHVPIMACDYNYF